MKIRRMKRSDLKAVARINYESFGTPLSKTRKVFGRAYKRAEKSACFVAEENGKIVGYVISEMQRYSFTPNCGYIFSFAVSAGHRRKGIGSQLLDATCKALRAKGAKNITLSVEVNKKPAFNLYKKKGFKNYKFVLKKVMR